MISAINLFSPLISVTLFSYASRNKTNGLTIKFEQKSFSIIANYISVEFLKAYFFIFFPG